MLTIDEALLLFASAILLTATWWGAALIAIL
jgi:hypothetical protein